MPARKATSRRDGTRSPPVTLAREESLLKRALDIARMGYWQAESPDSSTFWISPELAAMYQLETDEGRVAIQAIRDHYLGQAPEELARVYRQCWQVGEAYCVHGGYQRPDGTRLQFAVHGEAERDENGHVIRVSGIVRDITEETEVLKRVAASEQRLTDFVTTASDWCWETGPDHRFMALHEREGEPTGIKRVDIAGRTRRDLPVVPEDRERMDRHFEDILDHKPFRDFIYTVIAADGRRMTVRSSGKPVFDAGGIFLGYRGTASDITQLKQAEDMLDQRTTALREAHRMGKIGTWNYRLGETQVTWSPEIYVLMGLDPTQFDPTHEKVLARFLDDGAERLIELQKTVIRTRRTESIDLRAVRKDGSVGDFAMTCKAEIGDGKVLGIIGTVQDITERKEAQRQLEALAYSDPLTGLANRALFKRELASLIDACFLKGIAGALILIDLDRFKEVNDSLGHAAGDELLTKVALMLRQELGPKAFIARLGGDEFAVLPERRSIGDDVMELAERIITRLSGPMDLADGEAFIGATIGIANLPEDGSSVDVAMRNADLALYMAKEAGRGRCMIFEPAYAQAVEQRLDLGRHLRHAVEEGSLHAHYQAQVELQTQRVVGFESLLRWTHPERGPISPSEFIPIAESSGLIVDLGLWVLRESCRQARAWLDAGFPTRSVSVNVSPAQFWNMDFETAVSAVLAETGLPPNLLCLELTESLFVDHTEHRINRTLTALSSLGVRLALDDFGSGYSSLGYLTRLPFDCLKVDRSFVDGISTKPEKRKLLGGIIALSRGLGMSVVAEGAERAAEVDVLTDLGCDIVQGFVFARPVAPEAAPLIAAAIERKAGLVAPSLAPAADDDAHFDAAPIGV
jgi:diguanylate cyclase (GGDEF)-like protein/PAS domain S-box-containing protein